jgi:transcriptional regulator with XRE-family HTH domain
VRDCDTLSVLDIPTLVGGMNEGQALPLAQVIGEAVQRERKARGLTRDQLRDRLEAVGLPMGVMTLHRIETGERGEHRMLDVREWLLFALVLGVPPIALVTPASATEQTVTLSDRVEMPVHATHHWIVGMQGPLAADGSWPADTRPMDVDAARAPYIAWLELRTWQGEFERMVGRVHGMRELDHLAGGRLAPTAEQLRGEQVVLAHIARRFEAAVRRLVAVGGIPPRMTELTLRELARAVGRESDIDVWMGELKLAVWDPEAER